MRPAMWPAQIRPPAPGRRRAQEQRPARAGGSWAGRAAGMERPPVAWPDLAAERGSGAPGAWRAPGHHPPGCPPAYRGPAEAPAGNGAVSSNGAAARRASPAAAVTAPGSSVLTTTTGADRNSCWAMPTVSSSGGVLVSTTAAEDGSRVRAASESWDEPGPKGADEAVAGRVAEHAVTPKAAMDRAARIIPLRRRRRDCRGRGTPARGRLRDGRGYRQPGQSSGVRETRWQLRSVPCMTIPRERPSQVLCRPTRYRRAGGLTRTDTRLWPGRYGSAGHKLPDLSPRAP